MYSDSEESSSSDDDGHFISTGVQPDKVDDPDCNPYRSEIQKLKSEYIYVFNLLPFGVKLNVFHQFTYCSIIVHYIWDNIFIIGETF